MKALNWSEIHKAADGKTEYIDHIQVKTKDRVTIPLSEENKEKVDDKKVETPVINNIENNNKENNKESPTNKEVPKEINKEEPKEEDKSIQKESSKNKEANKTIEKNKDDSKQGTIKNIESKSVMKEEHKTIQVEPITS